MKRKGYWILLVTILIFIINFFVPSACTKVELKNGDILKINYDLSSQYRLWIYLNKGDTSINQLESLIQISSGVQNIPINLLKTAEFERKDDILMIFSLEKALLEAHGIDKKNIKVSIVSDVPVNLYRSSNRGILSSLYLFFDRDHVKRNGEWISFSKLMRATITM